MKQIEIPFNVWSKERLKVGRKTETSRNKKYGSVGDYFTVGGKRYFIREIRRITLGEIAQYYFAEEGANDSAEFIKVWEEIHPRKGFVAEQRVWMHFFYEA